MREVSRRCEHGKIQWCICTKISQWWGPLLCMLTKTLIKNTFQHKLPEWTFRVEGHWRLAGAHLSRFQPEEWLREFLPSDRGMSLCNSGKDKAGIKQVLAYAIFTVSLSPFQCMTFQGRWTSMKSLSFLFLVKSYTRRSSSKISKRSNY